MVIAVKVAVVVAVRVIIIVAFLVLEIEKEWLLLYCKKFSYIGLCNVNARTHARTPLSVPVRAMYPHWDLMLLWI